MKMRIGRRKFDITNKDLLFINETVCYVTTQRYFKDFQWLMPSMSKKQFKQLVEQKGLRLEKKILDYKEKNGVEHYISIYRFHIECIKGE